MLFSLSPFTENAISVYPSILQLQDPQVRAAVRELSHTAQMTSTYPGKAAILSNARGLSICGC
jgi:hypothetical protein